MSVSVSKAGPYYASGEIKFSSLRSNFRAQQRKDTSGGSETFTTDNASISTSELFRELDTAVTNPVVPDATENSNIATSADNLKLSQFRNSVKYYYITQSGTDENLVLEEQSWNSNLDKNINTFIFITGTCGSNSSSSPALSLSAVTNNLTVDIVGSILGAAGRGGGISGAPDPSGEGAGTAMSVSSSDGNVEILVRSGARIYGGGGGGERGKRGNNGGGGTCVDYTTSAGCGNVSCPGGYSLISAWDGGCCQTYCTGWGPWRNCSRCRRRTRYARCERRYSTSGGTGGAGGTGGTGRGFNNQSGSLQGSAGSSGSGGGGCGAQSGQRGETGGAGGDWASAGANTNNSGNGGSGARAISGSNYTVTGTINSSTIKGGYNP